MLQLWEGISRKGLLKVHEEKCVGEMLRKQRKVQEKFICQYCEKIFSSITATRPHEKNKHLVKINGAYILVPELINKNKQN